MSVPRSSENRFPGDPNKKPEEVSLLIEQLLPVDLLRAIHGCHGHGCLCLITCHACSSSPPGVFRPLEEGNKKSHPALTPAGWDNMCFSIFPFRFTVILLQASILYSCRPPALIAGRRMQGNLRLFLPVPCCHPADAAERGPCYGPSVAERSGGAGIQVDIKVQPALYYWSNWSTL